MTSKDFDPKIFLEDPAKLGQTVDGAHVAALKLQEGQHRQRLAAAQKRLEVARVVGDDAAMKSAQARIETRTVRLAGAEVQFELANVVPPDAAADSAQIAVAVIGETDAPPLCLGVLGPNGEQIAQEKVGANGAAQFSFETDQKGIRLQVFDGKSRILYRDADPFGAPLGEVIRRVVRLTGPIEECAPSPAALTMPDLIGQTEEAACAILYRLGVRDITTAEKTDDGPAGLVIGQSPEAGAPLDPSAGANLMISGPGGNGEPTTIEMPNFVGKEIDDVRAAAKELKIALTVKTVESAELAEGLVVAQDPEAGTTLEPPFAATVTVAVKPTEPNPDMVEVPDLVGKTEDEARAILKEMGIDVRVTKQPSGAPKGQVLRQSPAAGTIAPLPLTVELLVSSGDDTVPMVTIPDFTGQPVRRATKAAERLGLAVEIREIVGNAEPGIVLRQAPQAGTEVTLPATLTLTVQRGSGPVDDAGFAEKLVELAVADERFARLEIDPRKLAAALAEAGATGADGTRAIIDLDNGQMAERLGLDGRATARSLRPILRHALQKLVG